MTTTVMNTTADAYCVVIEKQTTSDSLLIKQVQTVADALIPDRQGLMTTADAWVGAVTVATEADGLILISSTTTTDAIAKTAMSTSTTADAYVTEAEGTFRGTMDTTARDALDLVQPNDTVINTDADRTPVHEYWTGTEWVGAALHSNPENKQLKYITAPTTAGWRAEMGDPTYPFQYEDGSTRLFYVDNAGNVRATTFIAGNTIMSDDNLIQIPEAEDYLIPTRVQSKLTTSNSTSSLVTSWDVDTTAGNLLVAVVQSGEGGVFYNGLAYDNTQDLYLSGSTSGWEWVDGDFEYTAVLIKKNCGAAETAPTVELVISTECTVTLLEYSNMELVDVLDTYSTYSSDILEDTSTRFDLWDVYEDTVTAWPNTVSIGYLYTTVATDHTTIYGGYGLVTEQGMTGDHRVSVIERVNLTETNFAASIAGSPTSEFWGGITVFRGTRSGVQTPPANNIYVYAMDVAGKTRMAFKDPNNRVILASPVKKFVPQTIDKSNTSADQTFIWWETEIQELHMGDILRISAYGFHNWKATSGTYTFKITAALFGGPGDSSSFSLIIPSQAGANSTNTDGAFYLTGELTIAGVGAGTDGQLDLQGGATVNAMMNTTGTPLAAYWPLVTMHTTEPAQTLTVSLSGKWATANSANRVVVKGASITLLSY